jgi:hypothetical protein
MSRSSPCTFSMFLMKSDSGNRITSSLNSRFLQLGPSATFAVDALKVIIPIFLFRIIPDTRQTYMLNNSLCFQRVCLVFPLTCLLSEIRLKAVNHSQFFYRVIVSDFRHKNIGSKNRSVPTTDFCNDLEAAPRAGIAPKVPIKNPAHYRGRYFLHPNVPGTTQMAVVVYCRPQSKPAFRDT